MGQQTVVLVPAGYALTLVATSAGSYFLVNNPGEEPGPNVAVSAGATVEVGPFNNARSYSLQSDNLDMTYSLTYAGVYDAESALPDLAAPKASPTFTGTVTLPSTWKIGSTTVLPTGAELNFVDGVTSAIQTQLDAKAPLASPIFTTTALRSTVGNGTANTGTTAVEYGDGRQHTTVLTVNTTLPAIAGGAALSVGTLLYTFPAGAIVVDKAYMSMAITQTQGNITADTPDVGLGMVIAAGANALLSDTAGAENVLTGQTANDCNGTAEVKTVADQILVIEAGEAHTLYFNVADDWAASGDEAAAIAGTVVIHWQFMA